MICTTIVGIIAYLLFILPTEVSVRIVAGIIGLIVVVAMLIVFYDILTQHYGED